MLYVSLPCTRFFHSRQIKCPMYIRRLWLYTSLVRLERQYWAKKINMTSIHAENCHETCVNFSKYMMAYVRSSIVLARVSDTYPRIFDGCVRGINFNEVFEKAAKTAADEMSRCYNIYVMFSVCCTSYNDIHDTLLMNHSPGLVGNHTPPQKIFRSLAPVRIKR